MQSHSRFGAVTGAALIALAFTVITWRPSQANSSTPVPRPDAAFDAAYRLARDLYSHGKYIEASRLAVKNAETASMLGFFHAAATSWSLAGSCSQVELRPKQAIERYLKAKSLAERVGDEAVIFGLCGNISGVYLQMGDADAARHYALMGLERPERLAQHESRDKLRLHLAQTYGLQHRFQDAEPIYQATLPSLETSDVKAAVIGWHRFGSDAIDAHRFNIAESALTRALYLARMNNVDDTSSILRKLARLRAAQGDSRSASSLYAAAVAAPQGTSPLWLVHSDRGEFRLSQRDYAGALEDFQKARSLVRLFRANVVPNDQSRVSQENGLARIASGFIEAGNHLAIGASRGQRLSETFDTAEEDRSSTLEALTPVKDDWRQRLPAEYWDLLSQYRSLERAAYPTPPGSELHIRADSLLMRITQLEAVAGSDVSTTSGGLKTSPLLHARSVLSPEDRFLSFRVGTAESWLWVVDGARIDVFRLPAGPRLEAQIHAFHDAVRLSADSKDTGFEKQGRALYNTLFGQLPLSALHARRWIVELDGPLFDLPLAALVLLDSPEGDPKYLCEKVGLQIAPSALLLRKGRPLAGGAFVGIADPIYNAADPRYKGSGLPALTLPRLPASRQEVSECARQWGRQRSTILSGADANLEKVTAGLQSQPAILHFATHIVSEPGEYKSGLIALGLNQHGELDLLGPKEIVARRIDADLVVMNGCQSGQAQAVPGSGLMGLTRAWIGAGANAVLATRWDVPDEQSQLLMVAFYQSITNHPEESLAFALQRAWIQLLQNRDLRRKPATWAAYFLLART